MKPARLRSDEATKGITARWRKPLCISRVSGSSAGVLPFADKPRQRREQCRRIRQMRDVTGASHQTGHTLTAAGLTDFSYFAVGTGLAGKLASGVSKGTLVEFK